MVSDLEILAFIADFQKAYPGISPSFREVMEALKIPSTGTVSSRISKLAKEGELALYREFIGFRCIMLRNVVLLSKSDAAKLGISDEVWDKLERSKRQALRKVEGLLNGP